MPTPPIIIIGMHRSGTSLVSRILEKNGLFLGANKDPNNESYFYMELNKWLLQQCGGRWDEPLPFCKLLTNNELCSLNEDYCRILLGQWRAGLYTGWFRRISGRTPLNMHEPWGWKDPRNTFTLPLWLRIYPNAKVVHVYRNGIDIASSLRVRALKELSNASAKHFCRKRYGLYSLIRKKTGFVGSPSILDLYSGFFLWEKYIKQAFSYDTMLADNIFHIKYEDLLSDPLPIVWQLLNFCGLYFRIELLQRELSELIQTDREFAYKADSELNRFYERMKNNYWMNKLGYVESTQ